MSITYHEPGQGKLFWKHPGDDLHECDYEVSVDDGKVLIHNSHDDTCDFLTLGEARAMALCLATAISELQRQQMASCRSISKNSQPTQGTQ